MSVTGVVRYGKLFGPNLTLRRTIRSTTRRECDRSRRRVLQRRQQPIPHAWLLAHQHRLPARRCRRRVLLRRQGRAARRIRLPSRASSKAATTSAPRPARAHRGGTEAVAYLYPRPTDRADERPSAWSTARSASAWRSITTLVSSRAASTGSTGVPANTSPHWSRATEVWKAGETLPRYARQHRAWREKRTDTPFAW